MSIENPSASSVDCPIVGIGASAGGLQPLEQFFHHMPAGSGAAFVVVQHLSPDFKSLMKELLSRHTSMKVCRIEDSMVPEPDSVMLIPPKMILTMEEGRLRVKERDDSEGHRLNFPIDRFFESLARECGSRAIGLVLSGTGSDGTSGIRAINEAGGYVLVQDPQSSQFDGMPRSAIRTGLSHYVQAPDQLARTIFEIVKRMEPQDEGAGLPADIDEGTLAQIIGILNTKENIDFSSYKTSTVARRIARRMPIAGFEAAEEYVRHLGTSADERAALRDDLLIGVTRFFRDPEAWAVLRENVIKPGLRDAEGRGVYRAWVAGCSTGEEVYSLAALLPPFHARTRARRSDQDLRHRHRQAGSRVRRAGGLPRVRDS